MESLQWPAFAGHSCKWAPKFIAAEDWVAWCQYPNIRGDVEGLRGPEWPWGGSKGQAEPVWAGHHAAGVGPHRRHQDMDGMSDIVVACAWAHNIAPAWSRPCRAWTGRGRWPVQLHDITLNYMQLHGESLQGITRNYMLITGDYTPLHACILQAITSNYMHVMACNEHVITSYSHVITCHYMHVITCNFILMHVITCNYMHVIACNYMQGHVITSSLHDHYMLLHACNYM